MDSTQDKLLIHVYRDYGMDDALFREEGYCSYTQEMSIYDLRTNQTTDSWTLSEGDFCTSGIFMGDSAVYTVLHVNYTSLLSPYNIYIKTGDHVNEIISGSATGTGFDDPRLVSLGKTQFAYSYIDENTKEFGVNAVSIDGEITPIVKLLDDGITEALRTTLYGNGASFLYYAAVEGSGCIFIGNAEGVEHQFLLPRTERVYDFCFLKDSVFFTMEVTQEGEGTSAKKIIVKDYNGNNIAEKDCDAFYRLVSNNYHCVLGIDGSYQVMYVTVSGKDIEISKMDVPKDFVLFYSISPSQFLLHYYGVNYGENKSLQELLQLDIP